MRILAADEARSRSTRAQEAADARDDRPCGASTLRRARLPQLEELIAPAIAKDLDAADNDVRPQLVAASLTAAFNVLTERGGGPRNPAERAALIDPVIRFLRGGLDALR